jgi:hypothetical protein
MIPDTVGSENFPLALPFTSSESSGFYLLETSVLLLGIRTGFINKVNHGERDMLDQRKEEK